MSSEEVSLSDAVPSINSVLEVPSGDSDTSSLLHGYVKYVRSYPLLLMALMGVPPQDTMLKPLFWCVSSSGAALLIVLPFGVLRWQAGTKHHMAAEIENFWSFIRGVLVPISDRVAALVGAVGSGSHWLIDAAAVEIVEAAKRMLGGLQETYPEIFMDGRCMVERIVSDVMNNCKQTPEWCSR